MADGMRDRSGTEAGGPVQPAGVAKVQRIAGAAAEYGLYADSPK